MSTQHEPYTHATPWHEPSVGERVRTHPASDVWMCGYRYGEVTDVRAFTVTVVVERLDTRRTVQMSKRDILPLERESATEATGRIHRAPR